MAPCVPVSLGLLTAFCSPPVTTVGRGFCEWTEGISQTSHLAVFLSSSLFHQICERETKLTEWNLIFPLYNFSQSFEEIEMCDKTVSMLSAEGREGQRRWACWPWGPHPWPQGGDSVPMANQILFLWDSGRCSWTKPVLLHWNGWSANYM